MILKILKHTNEKIIELENNIELIINQNKSNIQYFEIMKHTYLYEYILLKKKYQLFLCK